MGTAGQDTYPRDFTADWAYLAIPIRKYLRAGIVEAQFSRRRRDQSNLIVCGKTVGLAASIEQRSHVKAANCQADAAEFVQLGFERII